MAKNANLPILDSLANDALADVVSTNPLRDFSLPLDTHDIDEADYSHESRLDAPEHDWSGASDASPET